MNKGYLLEMLNDQRSREALTVEAIAKERLEENMADISVDVVRVARSIAKALGTAENEVVKKV